MTFCGVDARWEGPTVPFPEDMFQLENPAENDIWTLLKILRVFHLISGDFIREILPFVQCIFLQEPSGPT